MSTDYVVPRLRTKFGERAFSYAGPVAWNSLPVHVREEMDFYRFIRLLMTHTVTLHYTQSLLSSFFNLFFIYFTVAYVVLVFVF